MARLEEITVGASVAGLVGNTSVGVVAVKWNGTNARSVDMLVGTKSKFNKYKNSISFIERDVVETGVKLYG
jgi:hypothetical protein